MRTPIIILRCVAKAVLNGLTGGVLGDVVFEAAPEIWNEWKAAQPDDQAKRSELQSLAQLTFPELSAAIDQVEQEIAGSADESARQTLRAYLLHLQASVRQSFRRPDDPSGTTIPPGLMVRSEDDLGRLLPVHSSRFKPGDRPLEGSDWELVELIGVGGFGEVWKAENRSMSETAAVKFCLNASAASALANETLVLRQIKKHGAHPGIVQLKDTYLQAAPPFLLYEYVNGCDLASVIREWNRKHGGATPAQAAKIVRRIATIVAFAHSARPPIVHRDLKPANILVYKDPQGKSRFKITDFGLGAVATRNAQDQTRHGVSRSCLLATALRGSHTPLYASREQLNNHPPDPTDDVFALGVIWYQLLTGDLSSGAPHGSNWMDRLAERGMDRRQIQLLTSCFEDADDRPANAGELIEKMDPDYEWSESKQIRTALPSPKLASASSLSDESSVGETALCSVVRIEKEDKPNTHSDCCPSCGAPIASFPWTCRHCGDTRWGEIVDVSFGTLACIAGSAVGFYFMEDTLWRNIVGWGAGGVGVYGVLALIAGIVVGLTTRSTSPTELSPGAAGVASPASSVTMSPPRVLASSPTTDLPALAMPGDAESSFLPLEEPNHSQARDNSERASGARGYLRAWSLGGATLFLPVGAIPGVFACGFAHRVAGSWFDPIIADTIFGLILFLVLAGFAAGGAALGAIAPRIDKTGRIILRWFWFPLLSGGVAINVLVLPFDGGGVFALLAFALGVACYLAYQWYRTAHRIS